MNLLNTIVSFRKKYDDAIHLATVLLQDIVTLRKEITFDFEDEFRLLIRDDDNGDCSGCYHDIESVSACGDGSIAITDFDDDVFGIENLDAEAIFALLFEIEEKLDAVEATV